MRRQGRELTLMALYAIDGLPSFERQQALTRFWRFFSSQAVWEAMFAPPPPHPHPLDEPPLWEAFDKIEEDAAPPTAQFKAAREFATSQIAGILEHLKEIDAEIRKASRSWPLHRMPQVDRSILRQGIYELMFSTSVPPAAAINEAIEISKRYAERQSRSFINGILDRVYQTIPPR